MNIHKISAVVEETLWFRFTFKPYFSKLYQLLGKIKYDVRKNKFRFVIEIDHNIKIFDISQFPRFFEISHIRNFSNFWTPQISEIKFKFFLNVKNKILNFIFIHLLCFYFIWSSCSHKTSCRFWLSLTLFWMDTTGIVVNLMTLTDDWNREEEFQKL